jgi:hypothetical protein
VEALGRKFNSVANQYVQDVWVSFNSRRSSCTATFQSVQIHTNDDQLFESHVIPLRTLLQMNFSVLNLLVKEVNSNNLEDHHPHVLNFPWTRHAEITLREYPASSQAHNIYKHRI